MTKLEVWIGHDVYLSLPNHVKPGCQTNHFLLPFSLGFAAGVMLAASYWSLLGNKNISSYITPKLSPIKIEIDCHDFDLDFACLVHFLVAISWSSSMDDGSVI